MTTCQSILFTDGQITFTCQNLMVPAQRVVRSVISIIFTWSCNPVALVNKMTESAYFCTSPYVRVFLVPRTLLLGISVSQDLIA